MATIRDLWGLASSTHHPPNLFYGKYSPLNNFWPSVDLERLKRWQISVLKSNYKKNASVAQFNKFLKEIRDKGKHEDDTLFARLVQGINAGIQGYSNKVLKSNYQDVQDQILEPIYELIARLDTVGMINNSDVLFLTSIANLSRKKLDYTLKQKPQYLEKLGAWLMTKAGLGGFGTGAWLAKNPVFNETTAVQLIEDAIGLDTTKKISAGNLFRISITQSKKNQKMSKQAKNKALNDLCNKISRNSSNIILSKTGDKVDVKLSGEIGVDTFLQTLNDISNASIQLTITLTDNFYEKLKEASISLQAKATMGRKLINKKSKRVNFEIPLEDFYFSLLNGLRDTKVISQEKGVSAELQNTKSSMFANYVNYVVSKNIMKTGYGQNEFYFTKYGLMDFATMMEQQNFIIKIVETELSYLQVLKNKFILEDNLI